MSAAIVEIEQLCEDAVFEVCDARERYPTLCANELARCLRLESEICLEPAKQCTPSNLEVQRVPEEQRLLLESLRAQLIGKVDRPNLHRVEIRAAATKTNEPINAASANGRAEKLANLSSRLEDLKIAAEQIAREKHCEINKLIRQ